MLKKLRRWHFDVAFFAGLAMFAWAYWYIKPRPVWTSYFLNDNYFVKYSFNLLGFSADGQLIYSTHESTDKWPIPQIQRWSTLTGELLEEYPIEVPEVDRFLSQLPLTGPRYPGSNYSVTLCSDPRYFMLRYHQANQKDHQYIRLYRIDGKPVGKALEVHRSYHVDLVPDPLLSDRHWVVSFEMNTKKLELPVSLIDLDTGNTIRTIKKYGRYQLDSFPTVVAGRSLVYVKKATEDSPKQLELFNLQSGESQGVIQLPTGRYHDLAYVDDTDWAVCSMFGEQGSFTTRIDMYRCDPQSKTIRLDTSHPLHGLTSEHNQWHIIKPPYLIAIKSGEDKHNDSELIKTLLGWLARIGIARDGGSKTSYRVFDLATGQPLRQVTGLPGNVFPTDPTYRHEAMVTPGEPGISLYVVPHYLWETTLGWIEWLAWLLVLPWPLRYFVGGRAEFPRNIPAT